MKRCFVTLAASLIAAWGCSEEYFPDAPKPGAAKIAAGGFVPDPDTDYDPFKNLTEAERINAMGGTAGIENYYQLMIVQIAQALQVEEARTILHSTVPVWEDGEVKIAEIAMAHPDLLTALSRDFIEDVDERGFTNQLASRISGNSYDEKALLETAKAMFNLEIALVNPPGNAWDGKSAIPVVYVPTDQAAAVGVGVNTELAFFTIDTDIKIVDLSSPLLSVNFDEDPLLTAHHATTVVPAGINTWRLISSAWAHDPSVHPAEYHKKLLQPVKEITIYDNHEPFDWNKPEVYVAIRWPKVNAPNDYKKDLPDVDEIGKVYRKYDKLRTKHGTGGRRLDVFVMEDDWASGDDIMGCWKGKGFGSGCRTLTRNSGDCTDKDARLRVCVTNQTGG